MFFIEKDNKWYGRDTIVDIAEILDMSSRALGSRLQDAEFPVTLTCGTRVYQEPPSGVPVDVVHSKNKKKKNIGKAAAIKLWPENSEAAVNLQEIADTHGATLAELRKWHRDMRDQAEPLVFNGRNYYRTKPAKKAKPADPVKKRKRLPGQPLLLPGYETNGLGGARR